MSYPKIPLSGAVVAVTGGARGIGQAAAALFAAASATVRIGDLDEDAARQAAEAIGGTARGHRLDVTSRESFARFTGDVLDELGRIDILVNNAGIMPLGGFLTEDEATGRATFDVNVWGLVHGMHLVMPHMIERGSGHIVNVASMAGKLAIPGMALYNASKFAAVGLSAAVREEYRESGVSVTAILPGAVRTRLSSGVPLGRGLPTVDPEQVARAIVGSVRSRRAEITVPGYLAGWDLLSAATPERLMRLGRRAVADRRALTSIDHDARDGYQRAIAAQAQTRETQTRKAGT